jgi:hypothetical protein
MASQGGGRMSAAARPSHVIESVVRSQIEDAKFLLCQIEHYPFGGNVSGLFDAVTRLVDCIETIAAGYDPAHSGIVLDCMLDVNYELQSVRASLRRIQDRHDERAARRLGQMARATDRAVHLFDCLNMAIRHAMKGHPIGSDNMVRCMKLLDEIDGGTRYKRSLTEQKRAKKTERAETPVQRETNESGKA